MLCASGAFFPPFISIFCYFIYISSTNASEEILSFHVHNIVDEALKRRIWCLSIVGRWALQSFFPI